VQERIGSVARLVLILALAAPAVAGQQDDATFSLPVSFDRVWYRPAVKSGLGSAKQTGVLTVTEQGLEFASKKRSDFVPWSRVEMLSYSTMPGDPDTRWVVLGLYPVGGARGRVGLRDGSRMGYGGATEEIFATVASAMKLVRAGPYDVPDGTSPYITRSLQFALAVPSGWSDYEISNTLSDGRPLWGQTLFSPIDLGRLRDDPERIRIALRRIAAGKDLSVLLLRYEARSGFSCGSLKSAGRRRIGEEIDRAFRPYGLSADASWAEQPHRGCTAWTTRARLVHEETGVDVTFFAVSDGQTVYLLALRGASGEADLDDFKKFTQSLRIAVAR
jgi:hypothetical protein